MSREAFLARSLETSCAEEGFDLMAFGFMPEHVHLLVAAHNQDLKVSRRLARTKQPTSKKIKELLIEAGSSLVKQLTVRKRPGKFCSRRWQEGPVFDRNIFSPQAIATSKQFQNQW